MSLKTFQRRLIRVLSVLVIVAVLFCVGLYAYRTIFGYTYDSTLSGKDLAAGVKGDENITNIALFGLDTREGDPTTHSDCIIIATVDNTRGKIKLTSLMRDSLVSVDGVGDTKLNAAYNKGGPTLAIKTINETFGTDITDYVSVNFQQLATIIDELGGVEIDVLDYELDELNRVITDYGKEQNKEFKLIAKTGLQKLNGAQALCYGRIRKGGTGDDWGRVERQAIVLSAMFDSVQSASASKLLSLSQKLMPNVTTSLSLGEIAPLVVGALKDGKPALVHTRIPLDSEWRYGGSSNEYIVYDTDLAAERLRAFIYDDVLPSDTSVAHKPSEEGGDGPLGGGDFDEPPDAPTGTETTPPSVPADGTDPAAKAEEGGSYDPATGDYQDSDGDYYRLDEDGETRYYYDQEAYRAGLAQ